jgi:hypothetical protein
MATPEKATKTLIFTIPARQISVQSSSATLDTQLGFLLCLLWCLGAVSALLEIDDGEVSRHNEEDPNQKNMLAMVPPNEINKAEPSPTSDKSFHLEHDFTYHSKAPNTATACKARHPLHLQ